MAVRRRVDDAPTCHDGPLEFAIVRLTALFSQAENAGSILVARSTYSGKKVQVERLLSTGCDSKRANCGCHLVPFAKRAGGQGPPPPGETRPISGAIRVPLGVVH